MKRIKLFENFNNKVIGYHITDKKNIKSINKIGIEPRVPEDFGENGDTKGVYLFKRPDDFITALQSWFGERIEEWEEENDAEYNEVLLVIDLSNLNLLDSVEFEWTCIDHIDTSRILEVHDLNEINNYELAEDLEKRYH